MKNSRFNIHEKYHKKITPQAKIVNKNNFTYKIILPIIDRYSRGKKDVLDIGCGAGTLSFYLASKNHRLTGIDISEKAINACKKTAKNLGFENIKFLQMDFPDKVPNGKYDFIIFSEVIEHLKNDDLAIKQIYKLLKPGGILLLTTPSDKAPLYKLGLTKKFDKRVGHVKRYDIDELKTMLSNNKLYIIEAKIAEGIIRNFLFVNPIAGKLIRFIKFFMVSIVSKIDHLSCRLFGGSDIILLAKKK